MGKLIYTPRTINDEFVKDGLCAVSTLDKDGPTKNLYFLVGGIATQSYLPAKYRRPTSDIDLAVMRPLNYSDFKSFSKEPLAYLGDMGYNIEPKQGRVNFMLVYSKDRESGAIEFARRSPDNFAKLEPMLAFEFANSRKKCVEGGGCDFTYRTASPEDITAPKLARSVYLLKNHPELAEDKEISKSMHLDESKIAEQLNEIGALRDEAALNLGDFTLAQRLRFVSDIYDVRVLSEVTGFNERQLKEAFSFWGPLKNPSVERDALINHVLPRFNHVNGQ